MALGRRRGNREGMNAWPGYVDALSTLLMVIIFVLLVFVLAQGFLSVTLSSRDQALDRLNRQVAELSDLLALERGQGDELRANLGRLTEELRLATVARDAAQAQAGALRDERDRQSAERDSLREERTRLQARLSDLELSAGSASDRIAGLEQRLAEAQSRAESFGGGTAQTVRELTEARQQLQAAQQSNTQQAQEVARLAEQIRALTALRDELERRAAEALARAEAEGRNTQDEAARRQQAEASAAEQTRLAESARAQVALLNRQLTELRAELARIAGLLDAEEASGRDKDAQITALGQRLNAALAARVEELQRYRSDFFGRLRDVLGERPEIRIVGDRFVFQGEVLFPVGGADLSEAGRTQLRTLAGVLKEVSQRFPADLPWILRVDGHADRSPVRAGGRYASNWELSAARAIAVGQFLIGEGLPANHIAATAFGDNQPMDAGDSPEAFARNRRIELRLTDR